MAASKSNRIIATPSQYAKEHYLYVQEVGTLQSLSPHISKRENLTSFLFFIILKGSGTLYYQGQEHMLQAGDCVFLNCQEEYAHESSVEHPWELSWVHFYGKDMKSFYKSYAEQNKEVSFHPNDISDFLNTLSALYTSQTKQNSFTEITCHKYLTDLLYLLYTKQAQSEKESPSLTDKLTQVRNYLDEHYSQNISLEQLSSLFFVSKFHLSREFKRTYGITIGNYLLTKRLSAAKKQLRFTDDQIDTISHDCGFVDAGYFIKVFKKSEGMTPKQYRKKW